jgi:hypothetical protein
MGVDSQVQVRHPAPLPLGLGAPPVGYGATRNPTGLSPATSLPFRLPDPTDTPRHDTAGQRHERSFPTLTSAGEARRLEKGCPARDTWSPLGT